MNGNVGRTVIQQACVEGHSGDDFAHRGGFHLDAEYCGKRRLLERYECGKALMRGCHCRLLPGLLPLCGLSCEFERDRDRGLGGCGAMKPGKLIPCIERDDGTADFEREADFGKSAALAGECNDGIGTADYDCVARLPHSGRDREFDMRIGGVAVVGGQDPDGVAAGRTRATGRRLHHAAPSTAYEDRAARRDCASDLERERTHVVGASPAPMTAMEGKSAITLT